MDLLDLLHTGKKEKEEETVRSGPLEGPVVYGTTGPYEEEIDRLVRAIRQSDAILVGAGSGLSTAAGLDFGGKRLLQYFPDFVAKYHMKDMYTGCFAPFESREERWAYWTRWAWINRYEDIPGTALQTLKRILAGRDYFVLTTNIDHTFQRSGFPKDKLCYTQGDFGLFQCSVPCCQETYDNKEQLQQMIATTKDMKVPTALIPHCPHCGAEMDFSLYWDDTFVRDPGWHVAHERYEQYLAAHQQGKILFLELGVGYNSPGVIKWPFWQEVWHNPQATFASINLQTPSYPEALQDQSIVLSADIGKALEDVARKLLQAQSSQA